jgi:hypothetical protein
MMRSFHLDAQIALDWITDNPDSESVARAIAALESRIFSRASLIHSMHSADYAGKVKGLTMTMCLAFVRWHIVVGSQPMLRPAGIHWKQWEKLCKREIRLLEPIANSLLWLTEVLEAFHAE